MKDINTKSNTSCLSSPLSAILSPVWPRFPTSWPSPPSAHAIISSFNYPCRFALEALLSLGVCHIRCLALTEGHGLEGI